MQAAPERVPFRLRAIDVAFASNWRRPTALCAWRRAWPAISGAASLSDSDCAAYALAFSTNTSALREFVPTKGEVASLTLLFVEHFENKTQLTKEVRFDVEPVRR